MKLRSIVIALAAPLLLYAQQQPAPPLNAPVELPEVLVTGKELIDVGAGSKQAPMRPPLLSRARLDSLNPSEKLPIPRLPARNLPALHRPFQFFPGYVDASMGTLLTPSLAAGYSFLASGYRIDLDADIEASQGWVEHAGYLRSALNLRSTYIAPEQFIVFGGSTTHVNADAAYGTYNLFARRDAAERQRLRAGAAVDVEGTFDEYGYAAHVGYGVQSMTTTGFDALSDNALNGDLVIEQRGEGLRFGGEARVSLRSLGGSDYSFMHLRARATHKKGATRLRVSVGPQFAGSTLNEQRFGIGADLHADVRASNDVSITASASSGLRQLSFSDLFNANPYIDHAVTVDVPYDVLSLNGTVRYHPSIRLSVAGSIRLRYTDREPVWYASDEGMFTVRYLSVRRVDAHVDARYAVSTADELRADVLMTQATVVDSSAQPYVPSAQVSVSYRRVWTTQFTSDLGVIYIGQRWADMAARTALGGYVDLRARFDYTITPTLAVTLRAENILASTIVLWEGYRERGFFATAGLTWSF